MTNYSSNLIKALLATASVAVFALVVAAPVTMASDNGVFAGKAAFAATSPVNGDMMRRGRGGADDPAGDDNGGAPGADDPAGDDNGGGGGNGGGGQGRG